MAEAEVPTTVSAPVVSALDGESQKEVPGTLIVVFAAACGLSVANLYYAQPLLTSIEASFHVNKAAIGLVVTITQLGYAAGLLLLAPLGDLFENRRLITTVMAGTVIALLVGAFVTTFPGSLAASLAIGVLSVVAQILVPFAAHLAPAEARGRVVGQVMSGLLAGIVLARAFAGIVSGVVGWQAVYMISAILLAIMIVILNRMLPSRKPTFVKGYGPLIVSFIGIYRREPILRRRAFYQATMFATFSAFWTGITFLLSAPPYHFSQVKIGLFALAGVLGVLIAPIAGRLGDRGYERWLTGMAFLLAAGSFVLTLLQRQLWALILGAVFIDLAVQTTLVLGQRAIYTLNPSERGRLNTLYIATFFVGGAIGSGGVGIVFAHVGWPGIVALGAGFPLVAFVFWLTERRTVPKIALGRTS